MDGAMNAWRNISFGHPTCMNEQHLIRCMYDQIQGVYKFMYLSNTWMHKIHECLGSNAHSVTWMMKIHAWMYLEDPIPLDGTHACMEGN